MSTPTITSVPICDLGAEYESLRNPIQEALERVLRSGSYILGAESQAFESEIAEYCSARFAIGVNSGTDAILLALAGLGVGAGDEVIVPSMTFIATAEPIALLGARPVIVDIDPNTYTLDPQLMKKAITSRTRAIVAVHLYGQPADMHALQIVAEQHNLPIVEDMAQAIGAEWNGRRIGGIGKVACLSFFPTKNLGACGDAGAVITSDEVLAERIRMLRNHGAKVKYHHDVVGYNSRLDELQAAILRIKLKHLDAWTNRRIALAADYTERLSGLPLVLPQQGNHRKHVYHLYSVCSTERDSLRQFLETQGISTGLHYPAPLHLQQAFSNLGYKQGDFPEGERLARETMSLPLFPQMTTAQLEYVVKAVASYFQGNRHG